MKTVSQKFMDSWGRRDGKSGIVYIRYKRRYWNGAAYVYEGSWTQITMRGYAEVGSINWMLDAPLLNTIRASNVNIRLKNTDYEWVEQNSTTGKFAADGVSTLGYDPFLTKFQIQFGYVLDDGTTELVNLFTGVALDYIFDTANGYADVIVSGNEFLLQSADAQKVSTLFSAEATTPATGDGANLVFTTSSTGVWNINSKTGITVGGVAKAQGVDYTLSGMNTYLGAVTITFVIPPGIGAAVRVTGQKWKTSQKIEDLIGLLCDQAGIGSGNRSIQTAIFPVSNQRIIFNSQADWELGTFSDVDSKTLPGSISGPYTYFEDFSGGGGAWTQEAVGGSASISYASANMSVLCSGTGSNIATDKPQAKATGSYRFTATVVAASDPAHSNTQDGAVVMFFQTKTSASSKLKGYGLHFDLHQGLNNPIKLVRFDDVALVSGSGIQDLATIGNMDIGATHIWTITRDGSGLMNVYRDGSLVASATDNTYVTCAYFGVAAYTINSSASINLVVDNIITPPSATPGVWTSQEIDMTVAPTAWVPLTIVGDVGNGSQTFYTQTATVSGGPYDAAVAVNGSNVPQSALKRYVKVIWKPSGAAIAQFPRLDELILNWLSVVVILAMADFSGKTCFDAIQALAALCDFEWGFNGDGDFFFRSKSVSSTPNISLTQSDGITRITEFRPGYDSVLNVGQVTYGGYYSEYNSSSLPETSPTSQQRFMSLINSQNYSQFLLAYDASIADGRSQLIHDNNYKPKRRAKVQSKICPFLDLSDVMGISFFDKAIQVDNFFGDTLQQFGLSPLGPPENILCRAMPGKIVGMTLDPNNFKGEYQLQEVLT